MHGYRLTRRGKFVLTMLVMLISLASSLSFRGIVIASDKSDYKNNIKLSKPIYKTINLRIAAEEFKKEENNAELDIKTKEEFLSINVEDIKSYDKSKIAFLTFDDGPSENVTPLILDILDSYNIKASFFVLGNVLEKNNLVLKDIYARGHAIGIHSYSHDFNHLFKSEDNFINEIKMTEDILKKSLGESFSTRLFRFPGGSFEDYKMQYVDVLNENGYVRVDWNALTGDTEMYKPTPEMLLERLKATTKNKNNIVVLMHDSVTKYSTAEALPDVIEYLKSEGYEFAILK